MLVLLDVVEAGGFVPAEEFGQAVGDAVDGVESLVGVAVKDLGALDEHIGEGCAHFLCDGPVDLGHDFVASGDDGLGELWVGGDDFGEFEAAHAVGEDEVSGGFFGEVIAGGFDDFGDGGGEVVVFGPADGAGQGGGFGVCGFEIGLQVAGQAEEFDGGIDDFGGHAPVGREFAAGDGDEAVG